MVVLPCFQAVVEAAEKAVEQVTERGGVAISGGATPVVVRSRAG